MPVYVQASETVEYKHNALEVTQAGADAVNSASGKLTKSEKSIIKKVKSIVFTGESVGRNDQFYVKGVSGLDSKTLYEAESMDGKTGTFFNNYKDSETNPTYQASLFAHEGKHKDDYDKKIGHHHPNLKNSDPSRRSNVSEYRATKFQRQIFLKLMNKSSEADQADLKFINDYMERLMKDIPKVFH